jgi:hypothetical protein
MFLKPVSTLQIERIGIRSSPSPVGHHPINLPFRVLGLRDQEAHRFHTTNKFAPQKSKICGDVVMSSEADYAFRVTVQ